MNAMLTAAGALAGKELFKKVVLETYQLLVKHTGRKLKEWNTERQIERLYSKIGQVRKVKTIWQIDKAVDLLDFYCDSHVILNEKRRKVSYLSDFGTKENVLIQGIAGQGKSILLRYLCSVELARGEYIPIFLELRRVSHSESLKKRIFTAFEGLGLTVDNEIFEALAISGKLVLLMDAFDEVPDDLQTRVLTEIEDLITTRPSIRVIVTSRPHQNIRFSNYLNVVRLDNIQGDEYKTVIKKLASGQEWADTLIEHIRSRARHIRGLLCTPLIVTLLVLSYKSFKELPTKLSDFYDSLFQTLLQRHDGTKPGFRRMRSCILDDGQYRQVFEALCILAKKARQQSFSAESIFSLSLLALQQCALRENPLSYIDDIINVTCLIVRDGEEHRFIHKTVQEYYTASYIRKKAEAWAIKFYGRVMKILDNSWGQELEFLSEIDSYRYNKYYLLPLILDLLSLTKYELERPKEEVKLSDAYELLSMWFVAVDKQGPGNDFRPYYLLNRSKNHLSLKIIQNRTNEIFNSLNIALNRAGSKLEGLKAYQEKIRFKHREGGIFDKLICVGDLVKIGATQELSLIINSEFEQIFKKGQDIWKITRDEENPSFLEGLL